MKWLTGLLLGVGAILFSCCSSPDEQRASASFYYWRTAFRLSENEKKTLAENKVTRLYIRFLDVALVRGNPIPLSPVTFTDVPVQEIVPVVYIKNEVMMLAGLDEADLARKLVTYVDKICAAHAISYSELQLDCDWTLTSRERYFRFVEHVRKISGRKLSATIRLHQIKYAATTGVPSVDRGVLMYYNMGHIAADSSNSIYDRNTARRYTGKLEKYPLPLDVAFPVFGWGLHIRGNKVIALLPKVDENTFRKDGNFDMKDSPFFEVRKNIIKLGHYFEKGDRIKLESATDDNLREMVRDLEDILPARPDHIIFFDLDDANLRKFKHEDNIFKDISRDF